MADSPLEYAVGSGLATGDLGCLAGGVERFTAVRFFIALPKLRSIRADYLFGNDITFSMSRLFVQVG